MIRMEGPSVEALAGTFIEDWELNTGEGLKALEETSDIRSIPEKGTTPVQVVPSGPAIRPEVIHQLLLTTIYSAQKKLVLTTPYFVPDESLITALISAAHRQVDVIIVVPAEVDSRLVHYASRSLFDNLMSAGVTIAAFKGGLLHTKSITVDDGICVFGTVNLDMRSLWLNFEVSLFIYDRSGTASNVLRSAVFMFLEMGPVTTIPSECRGDATKLMPNRARSKKGVASTFKSASQALQPAADT